MTADRAITKTMDVRWSCMADREGSNSTANMGLFAKCQCSLVFVRVLNSAVFGMCFIAGHAPRLQAN